MMGGTAVAQALPVVLAPVISRLYGPAEYGLLTTFTAAATILAVAATLRYELAIVLPRDEADAAAITKLARTLLGMTTLILVVVVGVFADSIAQLAGRPQDLLWLYALVPAVAALAWYQVSSYIATRQRQFGVIARGAIAQQGMFVAVAIALGLGGISTGLVLARLSGYCAGALALFRPLRVEAAPAGESLPAVASRYRQFPLYNFPYSLVGTLGREFFVFALIAVGDYSAAGLYGLARSVIFVPTSFLSTALSQPYYKEAAASFRTPRLETLTLQMTRIIGRVMTPLFAIVAVLGQDLFGLVFGAEWRLGGAYALCIAPVALLSLFSSWPERIFEVAGRQGTSLSIQVGFDLTSALVAASLLTLGMSPLHTLAGISVVACGYHFSYIAAAFKIAHFRTARFLPVIGEIAALAIFWTFAAAMAKWVLGPGLLSIGAVGLGVALYGALLIKWVLREGSMFKDTQT